MKTVFKSLAVAGVVGTAASAPIAEEENPVNAQGKFETASAYYGSCAGAELAGYGDVADLLEAFTDLRVMAATVNDPGRLFALASAMNTPETFQIMVTCATEPALWDTWMENGTDPQVWAEAMTALVAAEGMVKWAQAPINADLWASALSHLDPARYADWGGAMTDPEFYSLFTDMVSLEWMEPRVEWMLTPSSYAPMFKIIGLDLG